MVATPALGVGDRQRLLLLHLHGLLLLLARLARALLLLLLLRRCRCRCCSCCRLLVVDECAPCHLGALLLRRRLLLLYGRDDGRAA
jgi:hypothetical protein